MWYMCALLCGFVLLNVQIAPCIFYAFIALIVGFRVCICVFAP